MKVNIKKINSNATTPTYGSTEAAGLDLYALIDTETNSLFIPSHTTVKINTGIAMEIPKGYFGAVYARSGLSIKNGLRPANCVGVIDSDYRGEIIVALYNDSMEDRIVYNGDRIAQIVITPYLHIELNEVTELSDTERGEGGFGSTDMK
jgi:dUTP pyrophosphatase